VTATEYIIDASAAAKRFAGAGEPSVKQLNDWWDEALSRGAGFLAPHLLRYELGNVLAKRARGDPGLNAPLREHLLQETLLGVRFVDGEGIAALAPPLTFYDASYLALARSAQATLVSYDGELLRHAKAAGVAVLTPS
jgi:predicted nucleic acid-binding protein